MAGKQRAQLASSSPCTCGLETTLELKGLDVEKVTGSGGGLLDSFRLGLVAQAAIPGSQEAADAAVLKVQGQSKQPK